MPRIQKPVCECGAIVSAGRTKEQFRVTTSTHKGPSRRTREEAEADLQWARDAESHEEFAGRLRKLHELTGRCKPVAKGKAQPHHPPLASSAALQDSLVTAPAAPSADMPHSPGKRKVNLDCETGVPVPDDSSAPCEKRLRLETGGG